MSATQADRIRRHVMSNEEAAKVAAEYEALLDVEVKARIVAEGGYLVIHREWRDLEDALARLAVIRGDAP